VIRDSCIPGSTYKIRLGGIIYDSRDELGVTKAELAESLQVSISTIDQWEIGGANPLLSKLKLLIKELELDPEDTLFSVCPPSAARCVLAALGVYTIPEDLLRRSQWSKEEWVGFAEEAKKAREAVKVSRRLVSVATNMSMGTLTAIERGLFKAGPSRAYKLAWIFGLEGVLAEDDVPTLVHTTA